MSEVAKATESFTAGPGARVITRTCETTGLRLVELSRLTDRMCRRPGR